MRKVLVVPRRRYRAPYTRTILRPTIIRPTVTRYVYPVTSNNQPYQTNAPFGEGEDVVPVVEEEEVVPVVEEEEKSVVEEAPTWLENIFTGVQGIPFIIIIILVLLLILWLLK